MVEDVGFNVVYDMLTSILLQFYWFSGGVSRAYKLLLSTSNNIRFNILINYCICL